jgi:hypothetical protein
VAVIRMQISVPQDTSLPRDRFVITPHFRTSFNASIGGADEQALVDDLAAGFDTWIQGSGMSREVLVKAYDAENPGTREAPAAPLAEAIRNPNVVRESSVPREVAVCLSFFSERNLKRQRGRLYIPAPFLYGSGITGNRPASDKRDLVAGLVPLFTGLGGVDVDWCVWSRRDLVARPVTHWYVDDEFDVQRRRGFRATTRTQGTTDEAGAVVTP